MKNIQVDGLSMDFIKYKINLKVSTGDMLRHRSTQNLILNPTVKKELKSVQ